MNNKTKYHWITIAVCCALAASAIGICNNSVGVFFAPVSNELGIGRGAFALHATISNLVAGLLCPMGIMLSRKYNYRAVMSIGIVMASGATMLMSLGGDVWLYYVLGAVRGIGCSLFALPTIAAIIGNWFEEKHGFAMGLTLSFSGLSGAIFSPMFSSIIIASGWRIAYIIMGALIAILALPGTLFILKFKPEEKNLLPYGALASKATEVEVKDKTKSKIKLLSKPVIIMAIFAFLSSSICGIAQHFPGYTVSVGSTATLGATMISAGMIGNIVFKLILGVMSDKFGPIKSCTIMGASNILSLVLLSFVDPNQSFVVMLAITFMYGAVYAVGAVGIPLLTRYVFGSEKYASVYSYIFMFTSIGSASSLTIIGLLYDYFKTYQIGIIGGIIFGSVNLILLVVLKKIKQTNENKNEELQEYVIN